MLQQKFPIKMGNKVWKGFPNTMKLIDAGDYLGASEEVMKSKWAKQTPNVQKHLVMH